MEAEYSLRDINKPIGISEYILTQTLPENFKSNLPTVEQLENQLSKEENEGEGEESSEIE